MTRTSTRPVLRHRITIPAVTTVENDLGEALDVHADGETVWAMVEPMGADARQRAERRGQTVSHTITIRWREGVSTSSRILWLNVHGPRWMRVVTALDPDERREWLTLSVQDDGEAQPE